MPAWRCMCFHASEKLLSDTAVPLFPSRTPSLAQVCLGAHSHDPPTLQPAFTFSSARLASEKQRPAPSPTSDFLLSIVCTTVNTSTGRRLNAGGLDLYLAKQITTKRKDHFVLLLFPSSSSSSLSLLTWLIVWLTPTREDSQRKAECHHSN